jgi:hypothetical protein
MGITGIPASLNSETKVIFCYIVAAPGLIIWTMRKQSLVETFSGAYDEASPDGLPSSTPQRFKLLRIYRCEIGAFPFHSSAFPSIADPQQVLPLAKVTLEAKTLGNLESRDQTAFDLLAALSGTFTG